MDIPLRRDHWRELDGVEMGQKRKLAPSKADPAVQIMLPAAIDLLYAGTLHRQAIETLTAHAALEIDGSLVERASTPCIQVLLATARQAEKSGLGFCLRRPSAVLVDAFDALGLGGDFEPWIDRP